MKSQDFLKSAVVPEIAVSRQGLILHESLIVINLSTSFNFKITIKDSDIYYHLCTRYPTALADM